MKKIGLIPMAAKPYHAGHDMLVRIAAKENDEVYLFVSLSDRKRPREITIHGKRMEIIWRKYLEKSLPSNVKIMYGGSPVGNLYKSLENAESSGTNNIFAVYSDEKDIVKNYPDDRLLKLTPRLFKNQQIKKRGISRNKTVSVSGTEMRRFLEAGNIEKFVEMLPPAVQKHGEKIFKILKK